jgi:hypothetical protein
MKNEMVRLIMLRTCSFSFNKLKSPCMIVYVLLVCFFVVISSLLIWDWYDF